MMGETQERVKTLLVETISLLCKSSLPYVEALNVEGLIGITVDRQDTVFVHISENLRDEAKTQEQALDYIKENLNSNFQNDAEAMSTMSTLSTESESQAMAKKSRRKRKAKQILPAGKKKKPDGDLPINQVFSVKSEPGVGIDDDDDDIDIAPRLQINEDASTEGAVSGEEENQAPMGEEGPPDLMPEAPQVTRKPRKGKPGKKVAGEDELVLVDTEEVNVDMSKYYTKVGEEDGEEDGEAEDNGEEEEMGEDGDDEVSGSEGSQGGEPTKKRAKPVLKINLLNPKKGSAKKRSSGGDDDSTETFIPIGSISWSADTMEDYVYKQGLDMRYGVHGGEKTYRCDYPGCDASYVQKGHLTRHQKHKHADEGAEKSVRFDCPYPGCMANYSWEGDLRTHVKKKHGTDYLNSLINGLGTSSPSQVSSPGSVHNMTI